MRKLLTTSVRKQIVIIMILMMVVPIAIVVNSALDERKHDISDANFILEKLAAQLSSEQKSILTDTERLLSTLEHIPMVHHHNIGAVNKILKDLVSSNPAYSNLLIMNAKGQLWASATPFQANISYSDRRYFKSAIASGKFSSGEFTHSRTLNKPVMNFAYPIKDLDGKITDVAVAVLTPENYAHSMKTATFPDKTSLTLTDHKGVVLYSLTSPHIVGKQDRDDLFRRMFEGGDAGRFEAKGITGVQRYFAYNKLRLSSEQIPYMYIRTGIPVYSVLSQSNRSLIFNIGGMLICMLITVLTAYYIIRRGILDKIVALSEATKKVALGEYGSYLSDKIVGGELGELASSFDKMTQELLEEKTEVLKNIEMRAHVEVNLRKEKLFFRATLDGLSAHICVIDRCGKIVITNRAWNAFAIENDAIEGTCGEGNDYLSVCSGITEHYETDIDEFAVGISGVINGTLAQFVKEYPCHSPDTDRWFICRVDPFTVSGSKYAVISHENITERKLAEMARIKLYSAVEQSPVTIVITDVNGVIEYVNSHFTVLTGYTAEEAIGQNPRILKSDQTPPETFQELWTVISSGKTWIGEFVNKCKDGRLIYEQATISPLCDANGIITNFLGIKEDITDKKK